jgi:uncharacterized repeat protein (TIGR01451 family)
MHTHPHSRRRHWWAAVTLGLLCAGLPRVAAAQTVQLAKITQGGFGTYDFALTNLSGTADSITTTADGTPTVSPTLFTVLDLATAVTITETPAAGFQLIDASCVNNGPTSPGPVGGPGGVGIVIPGGALPADAEVLCTFTNAAAVQDPDLAISKQVSPTTVASGGTVTYTLTASNVGAVDVSDAVLADTPGTGLSCTSAGSCSTSGGAICPAGVPAAALFGGGVAVPSLPVGGSVTVTVACTVTASGN